MLEDNLSIQNELPSSILQNNQIKKTNLTLKTKIFVQFCYLPYCPSIYKNSISDLDVKDLDRLVVLHGTVIRTSSVKPLVKERKYRCIQCLNEILLQAEHDNYCQFQLPYKCKNTTLKSKKDNPFMANLFKQAFNKNNNKNNQKQRNQNLEDDQDQPQQFGKKQPKLIESMCGSNKFEPIDLTEQYVDYQEIKIQEPFKTIKPGNIPKTMWIILECTLVDKLKPGDDIILTGVFIKRWKKVSIDSRPLITMAIYANNIVIKNHESKKLQQNNHEINSTLEQEFKDYWAQRKDIYFDIDTRNLIIQSICPDIYEKYDIKLAILLCLIGGVTRFVDNSRIRGQCHLLIVGEPGTGKSQLLKYATQLSHRSVFTNGIGSTSAGLTVSYTKESGEWMLEAGALVLADQGICCIDEFNLIKKQDFQSVLEAMEQQTISGIKAGTMSKLNSRASVLAACNPVTPGQKYNPQLDLEKNTGLTSPLLSRFDLIFIVTDVMNHEADKENCDFILNRFMKKDDRNYQYDQDFEHIWDIDKIREYIKFVKSKFEPDLTDRAEKLLVGYYKHLRQIEMYSKTTIRQLESLVRLCQAHARMMYRDKVDTFDAICVITLNECSFFSGILGNLIINDYIILDYSKYEELKEIIQTRLLENPQSRNM